MTNERVTELCQEGTRACDSGDFTGAIAIYSQAIDLDSENATAFHQRGWARAHLGDIQGEIEDWSMAIELDPSFDRAWADRAVARTAAQDLSGALADAERAVELNPKHATVLDPLLGRLRNRIEEDLQGADSAAAAALGPGSEQLGGVARRNFIQALAGVAVATVALAQAGCGTAKTAAGKGAVRWGMIIDLRRCVGCKACVVACKAENHTPPGVAYNVVMEEEVGEFPYVTRRFLPRPCMQCANSSCSQVCPTAATYRRPDGIVVVDYDKCIGCRYCIAACPYGARSFDFGENYAKDLTPHERQPSPEYGEQRLRVAGQSPDGNVRKCTFCLHRLANGLNPACAETCIGHAIHFGNLNDPEGTCRIHGEKLQELLVTRTHMRLKEELGNDPSVYYLT